MNRIVVRQGTGYDDFVEAEAGLASKLGIGVPTRSPLSSLLMRPLLWLAGRTARSVALDESGVSIQGVDRAWDEFGMSFETDHLVCVVMTRNAGPLVIKKAALDAATLAEVRTLVAQHVNENEGSVARIRGIRTGQVTPERMQRE